MISRQFEYRSFGSHWNSYTASHLHIVFFYRCNHVEDKNMLEIILSYLWGGKGIIIFPSSSNCSFLNNDTSNPSVSTLDKQSQKSCWYKWHFSEAAMMTSYVTLHPGAQSVTVIWAAAAEVYSKLGAHLLVSDLSTCLFIMKTLMQRNVFLYCNGLRKTLSF